MGLTPDSQRPVMLWAATLVVTLQCFQVIAGGSLRYTQNAWKFGDEWFGRLLLPNLPGYTLTGVAFIMVAAALLLGCQVLALVRRSWFPAVVVGVVLTLLGSAYIFCMAVFVSLPRFPDSDYPSDAELAFAGTRSLAWLASGLVILRWAWVLAFPPPSPLPPAPLSADDDH